jgi:hypothetical protein
MASSTQTHYHTFKSKWTADQLEARDTALEPLQFAQALTPLELEAFDDVIIHSSDGSEFLGRIVDTDDFDTDDSTWYVSLR